MSDLVSPPSDDDAPPGAGSRWSRRAIWGGFGLLAIAVAYMVFWFHAAGVVRTGIESWIEARRADGYRIEADGIGIRGFPLWITATIDAPRAGAPEAMPPWDWEGPTVVLRGRPWSPGLIEANLAGSHRLVLALGVGQVAWDIRAESLGIEVRLAAGCLQTASARIGNLKIVREGTDETLALARGTAGMRVPSAPDGHRAPSLEIKVEAEALSLAPDLDLPFGRNVSRLAVTAAVMGRIEPGSRAVSLAVWRDDGGTIEVSGLDLDYGPLAVRGSGTAALDARLQPVGAFSARIEGFFEAVDALRDQGVIRDRDAVTAKFVLGALAKKNRGDGRPSLSVPLTLQDSRFHVGPVPLFQVPEVRW